MSIGNSFGKAEVSSTLRPRAVLSNHPALPPPKYAQLASYLALEKNLQESLLLETQAARGDAEAQFNLGVCYQNGEGVAKDLAQAVAWFQKAANQGHTPAQETIRRLNEKTAPKKTR